MGVNWGYLAKTFPEALVIGMYPIFLTQKQGCFMLHFHARMTISKTTSMKDLNHRNYFNPLPGMPISGSSNSAANKDMMSKIQKNWDTVI